MRLQIYVVYFNLVLKRVGPRDRDPRGGTPGPGPQRWDPGTGTPKVGPRDRDPKVGPQFFFSQRFLYLRPYIYAHIFFLTPLHLCPDFSAFWNTIKSISALFKGLHHEGHG